MIKHDIFRIIKENPVELYTMWTILIVTLLTIFIGSVYSIFDDTATRAFLKKL